MRLLMVLWRRCRWQHRNVACVVWENSYTGAGSYHDRYIRRKRRAWQL